jgi:hypothetical protein
MPLMAKILMAALAALTLGACTPLTSSRPLFSLADAAGPTPLSEGVWTALNENCTREMAARTPLPEGCDQIVLHRRADGAYELKGAGKDSGGGERSAALTLIIAPAVSTSAADAYAPLYLVQLSPRDADATSSASPQSRVYAVFAPIGAMPAREAFFTDIDCTAILREGPITGVTEQHGPGGALSGCTTDSPAAVREAARRALIEALGHIDQDRLVFAHP